MRKIRDFFAGIGIVVGLAAATPSHALNVHSYVAANGSGSDCTLASPCLFTAAIAATNSGGLISCVDGMADGSTLFFAANVNKSLTIDCAGVSATSWYVTINAPGIVVTLRNLAIATLGAGFDVSGGYGINFQNGAALFVEHCVVQDWAVGILFAPPAGVAAKLHVTDTVIKNNGSVSNGGGIIIQPLGGSARAVIERSQVENNTYGILANGTSGLTLVEVKDSTIANSAADGIWAYTAAGTTSSIVVDHSASVENDGNGINAQGASAYVSLSDSTVDWNATGLATSSGGLILSYKNNMIAGNLSPGVTPLSISQQ